MRVVRTLSQPSFDGRRTGTAGNVLARRFIRDTFQQIGLAPARPDFFQVFAFVLDKPTGRLSGLPARTSYDDATNVLAMTAGKRTDARTIVVSAHYDHLGVVNGLTYPGADDNASGVAAMLAIARYVHAHPLTHRIVFAAFDAEELGLQGAKAFVAMPPVPLASIALDVNFDMVSRNDRNEIYGAGTFQNPSLLPVVTAVQRRSAVTVRLGHDRPKTSDSDPDDWTPQSDHGVFHRAGIPFIYFGVEDHPDYHKPTDTPDKIDPTFFGNVADMLLDFVVTVDQRLP
jgi:Zn-dependent M28 family amino/carboxypeptidase